LAVDEARKVKKKSIYVEREFLETVTMLPDRKMASDGTEVKCKQRMVKSGRVGEEDAHRVLLASGRQKRP
jgi:hypothetical protein